MRIQFYVISLLTILFASGSYAASNAENQQNFGEYTVHYSVFNSTFILPDVAKANGIKRSKYESLLNISVTRNDEHGGVPVNISGSVKNLLQQAKQLEFKTIQEKNTVYYIAPVRVSGKEVLHFDLSVLPENVRAPYKVKFTKTLYAD